MALRKRNRTEEQPRTESVGGGREADILVHREGGDAHVDAIEEGHEVAKPQIRNDPPHRLSNRLLLDVHAVPPDVRSLEEVGNDGSARQQRGTGIAREPRAPQLTTYTF
jgi:hypothetical protein